MHSAESVRPIELSPLETDPILSLLLLNTHLPIVRHVVLSCQSVHAGVITRFDNVIGRLIYLKGLFITAARELLLSHYHIERGPRQLDVLVLSTVLIS